MQTELGVRWITDHLLEEYFIDIKVGEIMREQRQLQRNIKAAMKQIAKLDKRFHKLKTPKLKHEAGVQLSRLKAQLVTDQAMLAGLVVAKENIDDHKNIPF